MFLQTSRTHEVRILVFSKGSLLSLLNKCYNVNLETPPLWHLKEHVLRGFSQILETSAPYLKSYWRGKVKKYLSRGPSMEGHISKVMCKHSVSEQRFSILAWWAFTSESPKTCVKNTDSQTQGIWSAGGYCPGIWIFTTFPRWFWCNLGLELSSWKCPSFHWGVARLQLSLSIFYKPVYVPHIPSCQRNGM